MRKRTIKAPPDLRAPDALERVRQFLQGEPDREALGEALQAAAEAGHLETVRLLLRAGATPRGVTELSPLGAAAAGGHTEVAAALLEAGAPVDIGFGEQALTPLMLAAGHGHLLLVRLLIAAGAVVDAVDVRGRTALAHASNGHYAEIVEYLQPLTAPENRRLPRPKVDDARTRQFLLAAEAGRLGEIRKLLATGIAVDVMMDTPLAGATALIRAARAGRERVVQVLLEGGATVDVAHEENEWTPLIAATQAKGNLPVLRLLLASGAQVDARDAEGHTPLIHAAAHKHLEQVEALLTAGADVNARSSGGMTALMHAARTDRWAGTPAALATTLRVLLAAGAEVEAQDARGRTALMHSVETGDRPDVVVLLLEAGAERSMQEEQGLTAADLARKYHRPKALALLV